MRDIMISANVISRYLTDFASDLPPHGLVSSIFFSPAGDEPLCPAPLCTATPSPHLQVANTDWAPPPPFPWLPRCHPGASEA